MDDLKLNIMLTVFICNSKTTGNALFGEQGMVQYSGTCLPPMRSGFQSCRQQHMWVEFVVGFSPLLWGVPQVVFPSPQKATFPNSNLTRNRVEKEPLCRLPLNHYLHCIYLFILFTIFVSEACHPKIKAVRCKKLKGTQGSEPLNSRLPSVVLLLKSWDIIVPTQ